jgi:predicted metal-dependent phosphoesterase TrpH
VQAAEPLAVLYVPAAQGVHATPLAPVYPALQVQDVSRVLLAIEAVLAGHVEQFAAAVNEYVLTSQDAHVPTPVAVLYVPAPQAVHATPLDAAVYPARQVQDVSRGLLAADEVLAGHAVQFTAAANE